MPGGGNYDWHRTCSSYPRPTIRRVAIADERDRPRA